MNKYLAIATYEQGHESFQWEQVYVMQIADHGDPFGISIAFRAHLVAVCIDG